MLLALVLACLPVGAFVAVRPMLERGADGERRIYLVNAVLVVVLLLLFVFISAGLGDDIYRCNVLQIRNCD